MNTLTVVSAALCQEGIIFSMPRPNRHNNIINEMYRLGIPKPAEREREQGFLLSDGTFADRQLAMTIAVNANQLITIPRYSDILFSEDLW